jgi:TetR/AcrR family transcriptional repressor of nem operon
MRYKQDHKDETRKRVVSAAARAVRAHGPDGVSVAEIMAEVGLTHGGFYAHFRSKEALVAAAIEQAFVENGERIQRAAEGLGDGEYLDHFVDYYVSETHRDGLERGCPLTALASDLPRQGAAARAAYDAGLKRLISRLASRLTVGAPEDREALAGSMMAEMAGAVTLARAVADPEFSSQILAQTRAAVKARMGLA